MPVIETDNKSVKALSGINLWHADMSSCSQRVRIALAEKNLPFVSNLIDLHSGENSSAEYQAIHPLGLVPALVIDGELIIESIDIINEIERRYKDVPLSPPQSAKSECVEMFNLIKLADNAQPFLKILTFEFLFSSVTPIAKEVFLKMQKNHKNESLKQFYRDCSQGFSRERILGAVKNCHCDFQHLDDALSDGRNYLTGEQFTLADIAWIPNFHRFDLFQWPFHHYPYLSAWFERIRTRPSYKTGLVDWEPSDYEVAISPKIRARIQSGDGVDSYLFLVNSRREQIAC